ncbi:hypothetical protein [Microbacterium sp. P02]|uniref:hypothetical protein n=1 Tax=Microbacterium sp. P02 TaxID=3366260 RepID=UPI00366EF168
MTRYYQFNQPQWFQLGDALIVRSDADGRSLASTPPLDGVPYLGVIPAGAVLPVDEVGSGHPDFVNVMVPTASESMPWPTDDPDVGQLTDQPGEEVQIEVLDYVASITRFPDVRLPTQEELDAWSAEDASETH